MDEEIIEVEEEIDEEEIELEEELCVYNQPHGTIEITTNGNHDVGQYENANVSVLPSLQDKSVTITTNGTTTITKDTGYDALNNVEVITSVSPILQDKSVSITENGTTTITKDEGYEGLNNVEITTNIVSENNAKIETTITQEHPSIFSNVTEISNITIPITNTSGNSLFTNCKMLQKIPYFEMSHVTTAEYMFSNCELLTTFPPLDMSNVTSISYMFYGCISLINAPSFNTQNVRLMRETFENCTALTNIPLYDTHHVTGRYAFTNTFRNCSNLSNESLNNILKMCINATSYNNNKTLTNLGLDATQRATCQTLSNWNDFVAAGWSV